MHDVIIKNGLVVDGLGTEPRETDVVIDGGKIVSVGSSTKRAKKEIDAKNHLVTPGFVDLHTHLDAQIGWDPLLTPISWHGVTTALMGNCGVTFAPCKRDDREFLASMMETVEDIPKEAIMDGLSWNWEHYGEYLNEVEKLEPAINVAGMIGHCALRYYVMGERSIEEQATDEEKQKMASIAGQAIDEGAVGFSTSRFLGHYIPDGRHVPGTHAEHAELVEIAREVGAKGALMQNVTNFAGDFEGEMELVRKQAEKARVLFSHGTGRTTSYGDKVDAIVSEMRSDGLDVNAICIPRASGFVSGIQATLPWRGGAWDELDKLPFSERVEKLKDFEFSNSLVKWADEHKSLISPNQIYYLGSGEKPNYTGTIEDSLGAESKRQGESPAQTFLRISRETNGKALFTLRFFNQNIDAVAKAISSDFCLPSLGDAGAHVGQVMDSGWATFVLTHWHRETGLFTLEEAIRRLTSAPARILGLKDRGLLREGFRADINVIDLDSLSESMPEMVSDFPGGTSRFIQRASGYAATLVNGKVILEDDSHTGVRAGTVLRRQ